MSIRDLVVCNEPQNCGTVKELESEVQRLKEQVEVLEFSRSNWKDASLTLDKRLAKAQEHFRTFPMDATMEYEELYQRAVHWWGDLGDILGIEKALGAGEEDEAND